MICPLHDTEMFEGKFGPVHKTYDDPKFPKGWCNGKEKAADTWNRRRDDFVGSLGKEPQAPVDWDRRSYRIERQHSQEMAIRFMDLWLRAGLESSAIKSFSDEVKTWTDWFMADLDKDDKDGK